MHNTPEAASGHKGTHRKGRVPARPIRPAPAPTPTPRMSLGSTWPMRTFRGEPYRWGGSR